MASKSRQKGLATRQRERAAIIKRAAERDQIMARKTAELAAAAERAILRVDPENTPEQREKQRLWEAEEAERAARQASDEARTAPLLLGGLGATLSRTDVDRIAARAEQLAAERRRIDRLIRNRPLTLSDR